MGSTPGSFDDVIVVTSTILGEVQRQLVAQRVEFVRAPFSASLPELVVITPDSTTASFQVDVPSPPSGGFRVRWEWGDGEVTEELDRTDASHTYTEVADFMIILVTLLSANGTQVLAVDTVHVEGEPATPHWRFTSMLNLSDLVPVAGEPLVSFLLQMVASPGTALLAIDEVPGGSSELSLRIRNSGTWNDGNCCPAGATVQAGVTRQRVGSSPSTFTAVGPYFNGFGEAGWTQSSTDLGAGSVTGREVVGTLSYNVRDAGTQIGPRLYLHLQGVRSGRTMTGTILLVYWPILDPQPFESVRYVDTPDAFEFSFTAERIR